MTKRKTVWHFNVKRPASLLDNSFVIASDTREVKKVVGKGFSTSVTVLEQGLGSNYTLDSETNALKKYLKNNLRKVSSLLARYNEYLAKVTKSLAALERSQTVGPRFNEQKRIWNNFESSYREYITFRVVTRVLGYEPAFSEDFLEKVAQQRMRYKKDWTIIRARFSGFLKRLAVLRQVNPNHLTCLTFDELSVFFNQSKKINVSRLVSARQGLAVIQAFVGRGMSIYTGSDARRIRNTLAAVEASVADKTSFSGQVACRGKTTGRVEVWTRYGGRKSRQPFILVTSMTTPEMVPMLKYVKGIITDEGGLTSHAAVISREFSIPCVIGTKIATQVLKDGDLVEVDANRGVVRKIK
ncbi:MAG: hypothetical protein HY397_01045 [Candidatus Doudnabacteria bacterium]|nr:hypothetical protein [Candidatus Doudnabacteria bacterium]